jgi:hypothetical protein
MWTEVNGMTIDVDALQALDEEQPEATDRCGLTCDWTCAFTASGG